MTLQGFHAFNLVTQKASVQYDLACMVERSRIGFLVGHMHSCVLVYQAVHHCIIRLNGLEFLGLCCKFF